MAVVDMPALLDRIQTAPIHVECGKVVRITGLIVEATSPGLALGSRCAIAGPRGLEPVPAEVVGFRENRALLMPFGSVHGIGPDCRVVPHPRQDELAVGHNLLGRVLDGLGRPIDGKGPVPGEAYVPIYRPAQRALARARITEPLPLGIAAIDAPLTIGRGQRIGVFSGSGVGKSVLLGMIARNSAASINVVALIGERGREVREFLEKNLGPEGLAHSVVVVVTSDESALLRVHGAAVATAIAEYFRDLGNDVLFMMDSVTRFAMAQREIGLAVGEPPTTKGYPPSVFAMLPRLLERTGHAPHGSITGIYAVYVEADDFNEPISDAVRSVLDGHIALSRSLAERNQYPAVDVLASVSRLMVDIVPPAHLRAARILRNVLSTYQEAEDLINIGAYVAGSNARIDYAMTKYEAAQAFLRQPIDGRRGWEDTIPQLEQLFADYPFEDMD